MVYNILSLESVFKSLFILHLLLHSYKYFTKKMGEAKKNIKYLKKIHIYCYFLLDYIRIN